MTEAEILKRIYPSVVTFVGDWRKMVKDVLRLKLKEISLFLTCAAFKERQKIFRALEETSVKHIPHVHLRHDMKEKELDYLVSKYKTKVFTVHYQYIKAFQSSKYAKNIFVETNAYHSRIKDPNRLKKMGGLCVDLSHIQHFKNYFPKDFEMSNKLIKKFKVGCNHVSAVLDNGRSGHMVKKISELDYLKDMPKNYFSKYICIELANPISEQLKFKKYIVKILVESW